MRCFATLFSAVVLVADTTRVRPTLDASTRETKPPDESSGYQSFSEQLPNGGETLDLSIPTSPVHHPTPMRFQRTVEAVTTRGYTFSFLPSLEGEWSGERRQVFGGDSTFRTSSSTKIAFNHASEQWEVRSSVAGSNSMAKVTKSELLPIGHGSCSVDGAVFEESRGGLFATMSSYCPMGSLAKYEIWSVSAVEDCDMLTRQVSTYSDDGSLESIFVDTEHRCEA